MAMCVSAGSQMFWSCVDKQQFVQASGGSSGDKREGGGHTGQRRRVLVAVTARRSAQRDWKYWQVVFSAGCGCLCQAPDACKHKNRSGDTLSGRRCSSWGVSRTFHQHLKQGEHVMLPRFKDVSKVSFLGETEAPSPARLLIVTVPQV